MVYHQQSRGMIKTTTITIVALVALIKIVSSTVNSNNLLESNDLPTINQRRPFVDQESNKLYRYIMDRFAPFTFTRTPPLDESTISLADFLRKENRFKKMYNNNYDDLIPIPSDHYNKKDNSVYKDAFIGVRG
ncbi:uncharacterized protein LOC128392151 [Panonychus citri]|uniref:uncharacterized protein LOC128392151 n=1 Tax=Panonychus citri TaxID=50023 RepID=UPI002306E9B8|nr:uncharacterized protein LOC128392151 [Panonychus citri]